MIAPVKALRTFSRDPGCGARAGLMHRDRATAIEIQRHYLKRAEEYYGLAIKAGNNPIYMEALVRTAAKLRAMEKDE